ncbi:hypothetical protein ACPOL_4900 [Acidisarcina polymorpha]|uniref:Uncharacterized protein n=1 Tax=Acidisarcina polymorpha TaxID=2211140 RepID=A0A2Z5G4T4_9BACT|nr:hypothetical protein ACPOL_4900 [Acidisarcina polymorpha]
MPVVSGKAREAIAWSSFLFAILQSICTFFAALSGLRLVIGIGSLALSTGVVTSLERLHSDWIRVPMIVVALVGALLNLVVIMQIRRLRNRPASRWRQRPLDPRKLRMERLQLILSFGTLSLIVIEEYLHFLKCHHL